MNKLIYFVELVQKTNRTFFSRKLYLTVHKMNAPRRGLENVYLTAEGLDCLYNF